MYYYAMNLTQEENCWPPIECWSDSYIHYYVEVFTLPVTNGKEICNK